MSRFFRWYNGLLQRHPWKTQAVQTGLLMGTGDFLAQTFVERKSTFHDYDKFRTLRVAGVGFVLVGPIFHKWYSVLDKIPIPGKLSPVLKMCLDQGFFAPIFLWNFISIMGILQGHTMKEVKDQLNQEYYDVMKNNYVVWPAVQMINFTLVPLPFRVFVVNVVCVFWNTYLSWVAHKKVKTENFVVQEKCSTDSQIANLTKRYSS